MAANEKKLRSSLYVGDLHSDVTEKDLTETFSRMGPLLSVHLCRDKFSGNSLRYAYVNFWLPCHAFAALKGLNHTPLKGKRMRIMWHESDPIARKDNNGNLFVKNLDKSITSLLLQEIFSKYGTILSCKVADENGVSKGFGYVQFKSEDSAIAARSALHDALVAGKKLYVSKFLRKNERNGGAEESFKSLHVKNLDEDVTADVLKAEFSNYGKVSNAVIMKDEKGKSKGFGYVNFDSHEAAKRAMVFLNGEMLGSKNIVIARAVKKSELRENSRQMSGYTYADQIKDSKASNIVANNVNRSVYGTANSAKPIWSYAVSRRFFFTPFSCPYDTNKALKPLTGAQAKKQEASKLQTPCEKFPSQPFYASKCQQLSYFSYQIPLKQLSPFHPTAAYQYFSSPPSISSYPITAQYIQGTFDAFPKEVGALNGYMQGRYLEMTKNHNGDGKKVSKGPVTAKISRGCMLPPLVQNLQKPGTNSWNVSTKMAMNAHTEKLFKSGGGKDRLF